MSNMIIWTNIGENIRHARELSDLSTRELGKRVGVSVASVSRWENGIQRIPLDKLQAVGGELGVSLRFLLRGLLDNPDEDWTEDVLSYFHNTGKIFPLDPKDAAIFLATEVGELMDAVMRRDDLWNRNNDRPANVEEELGDVMMMLLVTARSLEVDSVADAMYDKMIAGLLGSYFEEGVT